MCANSAYALLEKVGWALALHHMHTNKPKQHHRYGVTTILPYTMHTQRQNSATPLPT